MNSETRQCQNCKNDFIIEPDDFVFYEKMKVPPPTFCPGCRKIFRMVWRNERTLYQRKCNLCGKNIISIYKEELAFPVYCSECWWSDKWDPLKYGREYDFSKTFFEQLAVLKNEVPHLNLTVINNTNSPYVNQAWNSNNSYLCFDLGYAENAMYSKATHYVRDIADCSYCKKLELCAYCVDSRDSNKCVGLENCENCLDSYFLKNCKNCSSCILCTNLRNKSCCILNKQYSKEEYNNLKKEFIDGSRAKQEKSQKLFSEIILKSIVKENENLQAVNCTGNHIWQSKNCRNSFNVFNSENSNYINDIDNDVKDSMDLSNAAEGELMYNCVSSSGSNLMCCFWASYSNDIRYSMLCGKANSNLFGCISLNHKNYCILNKQYTPEDYEEMAKKIKEQMNFLPYTDSRGRKFVYGDYFPADFSPFGYNETIAQEHFPLTEGGAQKNGFKWYNPGDKNIPEIDFDETTLPESIGETGDDILGKVISCSHQGICNHQCTNAFKIIKTELELYRKLNIPLPRLCPNCRYYERLSKRTPMNLWRRQCQCAGVKSENSTYQNTAKHSHGDSHCPNEFETSYAPDRPEIVYCEACYQKEVI